MEITNEVLIDVREPEEFSNERIPGSINAPLSSWDRCGPMLAKSIGNHPIKFICGSGGRASIAAEKWETFFATKPPQIKIQDGGMRGWKSHGGVVEGSGKSVDWGIFRQVQAIVGPVILLSSIAAMTFNPRWAILSAMFGFGLSIAGYTGFCGMAIVLAKMPWNKAKKTMCEMKL